MHFDCGIALIAGSAQREILHLRRVVQIEQLAGVCTAVAAGADEQQGRNEPACATPLRSTSPCCSDLCCATASCVVRRRCPQMQCRGRRFAIRSGAVDAPKCFTCAAARLGIVHAGESDPIAVDVLRCGCRP
jgi:hypothetical protein